jgi:hypothetical protein
MLIMICVVPPRREVINITEERIGFMFRVEVLQLQLQQLQQ